MLCIQDLKAALNVRPDSLRAKVFMQLAWFFIYFFLQIRFNLTSSQTTFIINYVTFIIGQDASKRQFLSLVFLIS